jgi:hypothetical protein
MVFGAALAANCGDDSSGTTGGGGGDGPGGSGTIDEAGQSSGATTSMGATGGMGEAGSPVSMAGAGDLGGGPSAGGVGTAGGAGGAGGAGPSICPTNVANYPTVYAEAICRKRVECCAGDTGQACLTEVSAALDEILPGLAQAVQDGAADVDCSALELCVAAIDAAQCADWPKEIGLWGQPVDEPACLGIVKGKLAPEAACTATYQCDNGFCNNSACVAMVADGQSCASGICNVTTSYCDANDMCAPRLANGQACTGGDECQSRVCDTAGTDQCVAPDTTTECEYVPEGCSVGRRPVGNSAGWSLLAAALVLGASTRRRLRR